MSIQSRCAVRRGWPVSGTLAAILFVGSVAATAAAQGRPPILWSAAGHTYAVTAVDISPDGQMLVSASEDRTLKLWQYPQGELLRTLMVPYSADAQVTAITGARFTPDGAFIAASVSQYNGFTQTDFATSRLFRVSDGSVVRVFDGHAEEVSAVDVSPDGQWLATAESDYAKVWRVADGALVKTLTEHAGPATHVLFAPTGDRLCVAFDDGSAALWTTSAWSFEREIVTGDTSYIHTGFSPNGSLLATVSQDGNVRTWRIADGGLEHTAGVGSGLYAAAFSPDGGTLATGGFDRKIRFWNAGSLALLQTLADTGGYIEALHYATDGATLLSGGGYSSSRIRVWNAANGSLTRTWTEHAASIERVVFSTDSRLIGTAAPFDYAVRVFDAASGERRYVWSLGTARADDIAFSPDNQLAAMPGANNTVVVRRLSDGGVVQTLSGHQDEVTGVGFSHDGTLLASGSFFPGSIRLWRTSDWSLVREISSGQFFFGPFGSFSFSPDDTLLGCFGEGQPLVFRLSDGVRVASPSGITGCVTFSPNGQLFVVAGGAYQSDLRIYRVSDWMLVQSLPGGAVSAAFTADGAYLYTVQSDGLRVWRTADWTVVKAYDQEVGSAGSSLDVQSVAVAGDGARFAYGRFDATLVVAASPVGVVPADLNCDGAVNNQDIDGFILTLFDPGAYAQQYPNCNILNGDFTGDGLVNNQDIDAFVAALFGG